MIALAAVAVALVGCAPASERARGICAANGHALGTPGFDQCFETTFRSMAIANSGR